MIERPGKKDKYGERIKSKRATRFKKLRAQKQSGFTGQKLFSVVWENFDIPNIPKEGLETGIISSVKSSKDGKSFQILNKENKQLFEAFLDSEIPQELGEQIVIGDVVVYANKGGKYFILKRENRKNKISRFKGDSERFSFGKRIEQIIAANVDIGIIVASAKNPDFHSNFIDRYNSILNYGGIKPLICITKSDLNNLNDPILKWYEEKLGIQVVYCSTLTGQGIDELKKQIEGKIVVLVGNSGVGKSSLVNYLKGNTSIRTQAVGEKDGQGKHTTTSSALYEWSDNSFIIDTPGIRSLELLEIGKYELKNYFIEFEEFSPNCQFKDCTHSHEPNCGVKKSVENGQLSKERYENYLRIFNDLI